MTYQFILAAILSLFSIGSAWSAEVEKYEYEKEEYGPTLSMVSGVLGGLEVPLDELQGAKVVGGPGIIVMFPDRSHLSLEALTSKNAGYEGLDIRNWPIYLFGIKSKGSEPESYIEDLLKSKEHVIDFDIEPTSIRVFDTSRGKGYWAFGPEKSFIVLVDEKVSNQILIIKTAGVSEERIEKLIINGVI
ncbi:hypothetical protein [Marinobacter sp. NSM]|uniref:hypothetical protein n=1 Tax=Marinobacter sp. NSM TaxID=3458004 RepID=UPI0040355038